MNDEEMDFTDPQMLRIKAEAELKEKQKKEKKPVTETDVKKLLHELQVHQIELDMQNEELHNAYETAEAALKKYTMLYDLASIGYITLDSEGTICELNFSGADMLGDKRFALINSNFKLFVSDESKPVFNAFFKNLYISNFKESCEIMLGYDNKPLRYVYMEGFVTGDEQKCFISMVDISAFKKPDHP
jgi:hypothetical protein